MKVDIKLTETIDEPRVEIYTSKITKEIEDIVTYIKNDSSNIILAREGEELVVIDPDDIYMLRIEDKKVAIYIEKKCFFTVKRLCEIEKSLKKNFLRISKTTIINIKQISRVEPSFNGSMYIKLRNGLKDYISRKYVPELKKYLGL